MEREEWDGDLGFLPLLKGGSRLLDFQTLGGIQYISRCICQENWVSQMLRSLMEEFSLGRGFTGGHSHCSQEELSYNTRVEANFQHVSCSGPSARDGSPQCVSEGPGQTSKPTLDLPFSLMLPLGRMECCRNKTQGCRAGGGEYIIF